MSEFTLQIERDGHVARLWLNRPDVRNAFNQNVIAELRDTFERFASDTELRAVVLGGRWQGLLCPAPTCRG